MKWLRVSIVVLLATLGYAPIAQALDVPPKPTSSPVVDQADILTPEQEQQLSGKIEAAEQQTGNQVAVLTVSTLDGQPIEEYSLQVARQWGVGQKDRDSGVLLLVAVKDRQLRIEVGYGLEGALPDIRASQIIRDRIKPAFAAGDYNGGISSGVDGILLAIQGEKDPSIGKTTTAKPAVPWELIGLGILFVPTWLGAILGRSKSWWAGGVLGGVIGVIVIAVAGLSLLAVMSLIILPLLGLVFDRSVSRNYQRRASGGLAPSWWAGGSWFGGGRGGGGSGFGGFDGGGFGGGGSSGSW